MLHGRQQYWRLRPAVGGECADAHSIKGAFMPRQMANYAILHDDGATSGGFITAARLHESVKNVHISDM